MQVSALSFTGVVPLRVYIDGREAIDSENVQKGCRKLIETLAGPVKDDEQKTRIARKFALFDKDYDFFRAKNGYKCKVYEKGRLVKKTASHFFRFITNQGKNFLITGASAEHLADAGKNLGLAKADANLTAAKNSFEVYEAKQIYKHLISKITSNRSLRIREGFDPKTKIKKGNETILNIYLKSNQKYGKKNFKMDVDNIEFIPYSKN